ncbi:MAG: cellulase family glycosylhydrolase [Chitinophagaceae bacterium]
MQRRSFINKSGLLATGFAVSGTSLLSSFAPALKNKLPRWRGFNLTDFFATDPAQRKKFTTEEQLKWMRDWGFDFIRLPMAYPHYLKFDRTKNITPDDVYAIDERETAKIDSLVLLAHKQGLHVSLNLHRAPGYCINSGFKEPFDLWKDEKAQSAFCFHWAYWAKKYKNVSPKKISFDLVNEPSVRDLSDQHSKSSAVPGDVYRKVAKAAAEAIRKENPKHLVIADGNKVGNEPIPEITDLNIAQSCRGYNPGLISHYKAPWANSSPDAMPEPKWPGQVGSQYLNKELLKKYYQPWIDLVEKGVGVHCGECGCWNKTPHDVFLAWFEDVLSILTSAGIGYGLWEYIGDFGILNSGRTDVAYEDWHGHKLDRKLLTLLQKY